VNPVLTVAGIVAPVAVLALFAFGGIGRAVWLTLLRTALCLGVGAVVARGLQLDPVAAAVLILQVSTPVAVTQYMLAAKYGGDAEAVAGLVIVSTLMAVATLPLTLAFLI